MVLAPPPPPFQVALLETNPYLLALTIVVSIVHSVFEFLAFKNGERRPGTGSAAGVGGGTAPKPHPSASCRPRGGCWWVLSRPWGRARCRIEGAKPESGGFWVPASHPGRSPLPGEGG